MVCDRFLCMLLLALAGLVATAGVARGSTGEDIATVIARVVPTTVSIETDRMPSRAAGLDELAAAFGGPRGPPGEAVATGTGSGVIVRSDGLILTNHHVVAGALAVRVSLADKRQLPARVLGSDPRTDVALLKLESDERFPAAELGDSDRIRPGDAVMTIGHPYDFAFTVTAGIVSARGRRNVSRDEIQDYIQIDAAVNPGASGGPLVDRRGAVVGITTAIYSAANAEGPPPTGLSFAIPIRLAWRVAQDLLAGRRPARPWLGLEVDSPEDASPTAVPGALVRGVAVGGPADRAGVRPGDRVRSVSGEPILDGDELAALARSRGVGERIPLVVERDGRTLPLTLVVGDTRDADGPDGPELPAEQRWAGLALAAEDEAPALPGLRVLAVTPGSPAATAGVRPGDRIQKAAGQEVHDLEALRHLVKGRLATPLMLWRRDGPVAVVLVTP